MAATLLFAARASMAAPLSLEDCTRLALERSPSAEAARYSIEAAASRARAARASYYPTVGIHGEYGKAEGFDPAVTNGGSTAGVLRAQATLLDGGIRKHNVAAAEAHTAETIADERQQRADVIFAVRRSYFAALSARAEAAIHAEAIQDLTDFVTALDRQESLGIAPRNDALRARLTLAAEGTAERASKADFAAARAELASLTGAVIDGDALVDLGDPASGDLQAVSIEGAPAVVHARASLDAAEREAAAARAERWGRVGVTAEGGALGVRPAHTFEHDQGGQFLFELDLPLFDGGVIDQKAAAALADAQSARAHLADARRTVALALDRAAADVDRARSDLATARAAIPLAEEHLLLMRARHAGGGNVRLLEVLDALTVRVEAALALPRAAQAYRVAVATRAQLVGEVTP